MEKYQEPLYLSLLSPSIHTLEKSISLCSLTKHPQFRHIISLWLLGALVGTGEKAAGKKSEALSWVPECLKTGISTGRGYQPWPCPQRWKWYYIQLLPKGRFCCWDKTTSVILTPFHCLSSLNSPPEPLYIFSCFKMSLPLEEDSLLQVVRKYYERSSGPVSGTWKFFHQGA